MSSVEQNMKGIKAGGSVNQKSDVSSTRQYMKTVEAQQDVRQEIQAHQPTDLIQLAKELEQLRSILVTEAREPEHYTAIGVIRSAELEAEKQNGSKVFEHLSKAGKWVLDVATKIGTTVAADAIKHSLGMK